MVTLRGRNTGALAVLLLPGPWAAMVDPAVDGLGSPFCFLAKPSGLLGGVGGGGATQVTWDGAFYTGAAELCIVTGDPPRPVAVRTKRLGAGYMPIVHYSWLEGDVRLSVSAFAAALSRGGPPATFIQLRMSRLGDSGGPASIGFGLRHCGLDHRASLPQTIPFDPSAQFAFEDDATLIGGRVVCLMPDTQPDRRYAVAGEPYTGPFRGSDYGIGPKTAVLLALWDLGRRDEMAIDLKMPWTPVSANVQADLRSLRQASFAEYADQVSQAWQAELGRGLQVLLPEEKPLHAYRANLTTILISTEMPTEGRPRFRNPLGSEPLALGDWAVLVEALDRSGRPELARAFLEAWLEQQCADGCLSPDEDLDAHCNGLRALSAHAWLVGDRLWAEQVYPKVWKGAEWALSRLENQRNLAGSRVLLGTIEILGEAAELAELIGKRQEAAELKMHRMRLIGELEADPRTAPLAVSSASWAVEANRALSDSSVVSVVAPHSEFIGDLCRRMRQASAEGLATQDGLLAPVLTMDLARLHALRGEQQQAVRDLYSVLVHTGSCHEGFVGGVKPWADRDCGQYPCPDPRFSAAYVLFLRDLLIREEHGTLHLFNAFSPSWLKPGCTLGIANAPTFFGLVTAVLRIEEGGAALTMAADWHLPPSRVIVHLPYWVELNYVDADRPGLKQISGPRPMAYDSLDVPAAGADGTNTWVEVRPDTTRVTLRWTTRETPELSYEAAVEEWRQQYIARYQDYLAAGHTPLSLEPIPLQ